MMLPQLPVTLKQPTVDHFRDGDEKGKLFVGGISWDTTNTNLLKYFTRYGEVIDCVVMKNPATGKSRGFGFVKFRDSAVIEVVLASQPHTIDSRQVDVKACNPRWMNKGGKSAEKNKYKIFMGGLPTNATEETVRETFEQFGKVIDLVIMFDQEKQKSRGFGFLSYEAEESVNRVCSAQYIEVSGKKVECKRAEPRDPKQQLPGAAGAAMLLAGGLLGQSMMGLPGMQGMQMTGSSLMAGGMPAMQGMQGMQGMPGLTMMSMPNIPLTQLNTGGFGGPMAWPTQATLPAASPELKVEPSWDASQYVAASTGTPQLGVSSPTVSTAGYAGQMVPVDASPQPGTERVLPATAYTIPGTGQPGSPTEVFAESKGGYVVYNSPAGPALGMLGNYAQEASSYGPARVLAADTMKISPAAMAGLMSPFAYSTANPAAYSQLHNPLHSAYAGQMSAMGGLVPFGYENQSYTMQPAMRTLTAAAAQAFHPYRRDDAR